MSESPPEGLWEAVHLVADWYDGERLGIANYQGTPHLFESRWDQAKGFWEGEEGEAHYSYHYWLSPIRDVALEGALSEWRVWQHWRGDAGGETPAELDDTEAWQSALVARVVDDLNAGRAGAFKRVGQFSESGVQWRLP